MVSNPTNNDNVGDKNEGLMEQYNFWYDWCKHEDDLFTNRGSFFLVGESMLLAGFAALNNGNKHSLFVFGFTGVFVTLIWIFINYVHIFRIQNNIKEKIYKLENELSLERFTWISSKQITSFKKIRSWGQHIIIGIGLPVVILIAWIALLLLQINGIMCFY